MTGGVKSAQITISEHWHDHVQHKTVGKAPRWDAELGVVCACGQVLGWPDPEHKETLSQYTKRVASERVDAASAPGRVQGAFGSYPGSADNAPELGDYPEPEQREPEPGPSTEVYPDGDLPVSNVDDPGPGEPPGDYSEPGPDDGPTPVHPDEEHDGDPGPEEPEVDWGEPPADEPDPEPLAIEDGDSEDVGTAPFPESAVPDERGYMIFEGKSYGRPEPAVGDAVPEYAVGDTVTVAGVDFTKVAEDPFPAPADEAQAESDLPPWTVDTDDGSDCAVPECDTSHAPGSDFCDEHRAPIGHGWNDGERTEAAEIAVGSQEEYSGGQPEIPSNEGIVDTPPSGLVPWNGTGERPERWQDSTGVGWVPPENATAEEIAEAGLYPVPGGEVAVSERAFAAGKAEEPEVGRDLVPYAGTPIMPTDAQQLDPLVGRLAPLDPSLPYTPQDVELKIVEIMRQLENSELFLRQQLSRLHQATHNHDFRYNLALAQSDQRAADQRKAEAWLATEKERHEMTEADMLVRALRDSQHNLRSQLSGFQSVARSLAVSMVNSLDGRERPPLPPEPPRYN